MENKYKNYKTTTAFFIFIICFVYAVCKENIALVEATGFIALISWALLKASSETLNKVISSLSEAIKTKWTK